MTSEKWHICDFRNMSFLTGHLSFVIFLLLSACGKEAPPLPPFIRIPEAVNDLTAAQSGHDLILTWTNPAKNIDGSAATNLARVQIRSDGAIFATLNVSAPGQPQSHLIPAGSVVDARRTFTAVIETTQGKTSRVSNTASITPIEVPGRVRQLRAVVDQRRIVLDWEKPLEHPELADAYVVGRTDIPAESQTISGTRYEDDQYEPGKVLTYQVTAARRVGGNTILGVGPQSIPVTVEDTTPPQVPAGLDIVQSDTGAYLTWAPNSETDLAGYHVFRSDSANGDFRPVSDRLVTTNAFFDPSSRSGQYYSVSAVDEFGNESAMSAALRAP
jgi:fibronectin type 3 domain-containing protein